MNLLSKAYSSLPLHLAEVYLGLSADDVLKAAQENNWAYDTTRQVIIPRATAVPDTVAAVPPSAGSGELFGPPTKFYAHSDSYIQFLRDQRLTLL